MDDTKKWIKILENDLHSLKQSKPITLDDLDLTGHDADTRKSIINVVNVMNDSYNERVKIYQDMIKKLKRGEPL